MLYKYTYLLTYILKYLCGGKAKVWGGGAIAPLPQRRTTPGLLKEAEDLAAVQSCRYCCAVEAMPLICGVVSRVQCSCTFNNDRHVTYTYTYCPSMIGPYKISVQFAGRQIPKSPFTVHVEGDPSKVTVQGPGVDATGLLQVDKPTSFHVHTAGQWRGDISTPSVTSKETICSQKQENAKYTNTFVTDIENV